MDEAETLNRLEKKAMKGKATDRELRLLVEAYTMHSIKVPTKIMKQMGY
tara:strand:+ start:685 stop:831 length:147 start_codon:yes stop_codon:yes gene_type:complete